MNALFWSALVALVLLGLWVQLWANRLDRLHVRTDAAAAGLRAALERRAVVARAIAALLPPVAGARLRAAADTAEHAQPTERESAENELTHLLVGVTDLAPDLRAELVDAEQRVLIARRVHNDAVRDTLALRGTRLVRWFRLAGTAAAPRYFEIAEEPLTAAGPARRTVARVVVLDDHGRVLLVRGSDPIQPQRCCWLTVGGGVSDGEDLRAVAVRQLREETGLSVADETLVGPVWRREGRLGQDGTSPLAREWFFVACGGPDLQTDVTVVEDGRPTTTRRRWWSAAELRDTAEVVYPARLGELLPSVSCLDGWDGVTHLIT